MKPRPGFELERAYSTPLAGVDEAGCGPLAGPVVAAAVILDRDRFPRGIDDSKALSEAAREAIHARLLASATVGVGIASVAEIDALNAMTYRTLNNAVYGAGFSTVQADYERYVVRMFETLDALEREVRAGVTTKTLDDVAAAVVARRGARSAPAPSR